MSESQKTSRKPSSRLLVVVSVDGMQPSLLEHSEKLGLSIPTLRHLVRSGASASSVQSVYPSTTYPAHATLVTGALPRNHGIYSHLDSRDPSSPARPWHWFGRALRVPTLWQAAHGAGLKTASVGWPVTAGAAIDFNIPEIWDLDAVDPYYSFEAVAQNSTPGLFMEVQAGLDSNSAGMTHDRLRTEAALYIWRKYKPNLLLLHLVEYDAEAHHRGPFSGEALRALERSDRELARIQEAIGPDAWLVVLSDHGFVPVVTDAAPQIALANHGLFGRNGAGGVTIKNLGAIHAGGSFAIYWHSRPAEQERQALSAAVADISATGAVGKTVAPEQLRELGADPDAAIILDAAPGFFFSDRNNGSLIQPAVDDHGTHGQLPSTPGLEACFIAIGPGIKKGKNLGRLSLTQVAPTLAHLLNLPAEGLASDGQAIDLA